MNIRIIASMNLFILLISSIACSPLLLKTLGLEGISSDIRNINNNINELKSLQDRVNKNICTVNTTMHAFQSHLENKIKDEIADIKKQLNKETNKIVSSLTDITKLADITNLNKLKLGDTVPTQMKSYARLSGDIFHK